jgi:molybdopterin converting factor small subunit
MGATVAALVDDLERRHPGIKERICDESGQVRRFRQHLREREDIRFLKHLDTPLKAGDELSIVPRDRRRALVLLSARATLARPAAPGEGPLVVPSALQLVGNTPVVELQSIRDGIPPGVRLLGKLEGFNPGGSVKDRPGPQDGRGRARLRLVSRRGRRSSTRPRATPASRSRWWARRSGIPSSW